MAVDRKITSKNIREIVKGLAAMPDENRRFERLTATQETLSLVYANPDVYEQAKNMLTGNNLFILEAGFESNITKRYKMVQKKLCELNTLQFAVTVNILPPLKYYMLLKERCERCNDNAACIVFEERIKGDPEADDEVLRLGLLGLWEIEDNWHAGELLVALDVITEEEFKRTIAEKEGVEAAPPAPPEIPAGFEDAIKGMKAEGKEWDAILAYINTEFGHDGQLISAAAAIFYQTQSTTTPPPEPTVPAEVKPAPPTIQEGDIKDMKTEIEERMEKLKREKQTPEEPTPKQETLFVKEEIIIPPSDLTLAYMQPSDYEKWRFWDFEGIIPGLEFEDLQELSDYVGLAEKMTDQEKDDIRAIISKRINEIRIEGL